MVVTKYNKETDINSLIIFLIIAMVTYAMKKSTFSEQYIGWAYKFRESICGTNFWNYLVSKLCVKGMIL